MKQDADDKTNDWDEPDMTCKRCESYNPTGVNEGECRLYPPKVFPAMTPQGPVTVAAYPKVSADWWCSSGFEPKLNG